MKKILEMTQKATKKLHPVKSSLYFSDMPWKVTYIYIFIIYILRNTHQKAMS